MILKEMPKEQTEKQKKLIDIFIIHFIKKAKVMSSKTNVS